MLMCIDIKEASNRISNTSQSTIIGLTQPCDLMLNKVHRIGTGMYLIRVGQKMTVVEPAKIGADHADKCLAFEIH